MLPGFEKSLIGLKRGDHKESLLPPEEAFGNGNPDNIQRFPARNFRQLLEDELLPARVGSIVSFKDSAGQERPGVLTQIDKEFVEVDFNHPLARRSIRFQVKIVAVTSPDADVVQVKL